MLSCQRDLFSLPEGLHYLNSASKSPLLKSSQEAAHRDLQRMVNPALVLDGEFFDRTDALRGLVGQLVNASPDQVAFGPAADR